MPATARIDSDLPAAATYRKADPRLREVNPDAREDLDAALEAESHFERSVYHLWSLRMKWQPEDSSYYRQLPS